MAVAQVSSAPSRELYDAVTKQLDLDGQRPEGMLIHAASELPSGEVQIIDVYESREALEAFAKSRLFPAFAAAGVEDVAMRGGRPVAYEAFDLIV
ncbi:MAG TPA: hypothetical protein VFJ17_07965 [Mycobacteriales bacterium]|jgi:hypothetical protein|nr:hypothetical protein [Mycobacteriales bacterium]